MLRGDLPAAVTPTCPTASAPTPAKRLPHRAHAAHPAHDDRRRARLRRIDHTRAAPPGTPPGAGLRQRAGSAVPAGLGRARMFHDFAARPRQTLGARAPVLVRGGVLAGSAVHARLVRSAVVEIWEREGKTTVG